MLVESGAKGLRLAAVNAAGRNFGLMRGMRLADARAQVPDLFSELHAPDEDMSSLLGLCRWMERYSPWVAPDAPDGILLDVTGVPHLFGGEARMLADIRSRLAQYGFTARCGQGATIGAAWALARYAGTSSPRANGGGKGPITKVMGEERGASTLPAGKVRVPLIFPPLTRRVPSSPPSQGEKTSRRFPSRPCGSTPSRRGPCGDWASRRWGR